MDVGIGIDKFEYRFRYGCFNRLGGSSIQGFRAPLKGFGVPFGLKAGSEMLGWYDLMVPYGCVYKLRVVFVGVLIIRALLFGVYSRAPGFWKLPYGLICFTVYSLIKPY